MHALAVTYLILGADYFLLVSVNVIRRTQQNLSLADCHLLRKLWKSVRFLYLLAKSRQASFNPTQMWIVLH
ncbi:hypothetical protein [Methylobacterium sp. WL116]|uniref:hypothetical protein n=1 Tax=Methylobacterium sp. WL116 TaxID=2603889 RepID=UPI0011C85829|nr:hypothetical protein [Methylobacterium sp. WL116]TXM95035.1 hypothetical protein FV223_02240 [Methylobacterium sp. WL116]